MSWSMSRDNLAKIRVDEMLWLRVRSGSVLIDGKFKFSIPEGRHLDEIRLEFDPTVQLRAVANEKTNEPETWLDGGRQFALIALKEPITDRQFIYEAAFVLSNATGIGHLRIPRIAVLAEQRNTQMLAVSVIDGLQYEVLNSSNEEPTAVGDFLSQWDDINVGTPPQMAFEQLGIDATWELATRPIETRTTGDQDIDIVVGPEKATVLYSCVLTTTQGNLLAHQLNVPADLSVESVSFAEGDENRTVRWARANRSQVTLMFNEQISGPQKIELIGTFPAKRRRVAWPGIRCTTAQINSTQLNIYRTADVSVEVARADGFTQNSDLQSGVYEGGSGRLVASLRNESETAVQRVALQIKPNRPKVACTQLTRMIRRNGEWMAEITVHLNIENGDVDELRFEIPNSLDNPEAIKPSSDFVVEQVPNRNRRRLIYRIAAPVTGEYIFRFTSRINLQPVSSPDVKLLDVAQFEQYLSLPARIADRQVRWETSGLVETELPDFMLSGSNIDVPQMLLHVVRPKFNAVIQDVRSVSGTVSIQLADVRLAYRQDGTYEGVASFDLHPAGIRQCVLTLPTGCNLIHSWSAGLPALLDPLGNNRWNIQLGPDQLPQRIVVVYEKKTSVGGPAIDRCQLAAPRLTGIPIKQTAWTIRGPSADFELDASSKLKVVDPTTQEYHRYKAVADLIGMAEDSAKERPAVETQNWYSRWANRLASSYSKLDDVKTSEVDLHTEGIDIETIKEQQEEIAQRLKTTKILSQMTTANGANSLEAPDVWSQSGSDETVVYAMSDGAAPTIEVSVQSVRTSDWSLRVWHAIIFLLICLALYVLIRRTSISDLFLEWPLAFGVLLGIVWMVWLTPSIVGFLIITASVVRSLRPNWIFISE